MKYMNRLSAIAIALLVVPAGALAQGATNSKGERPNIIVIMTDDMGYSDLGSFGGEIETPNLDKLAHDGVRFTQFYNTARCCPSRAALLTGNYSHQAGVGHMLRRTGHPGYSDHLSTDTVTMGEVLQQAGYNTYAVGKWHVARSINKNGPKDHWPLQRGFEKYYGIITGASSFFDPATLCRGNQYITVANDPEYKPENYYFTDAIADNAIKYIDEHKAESPENPFFMYVAFTAAHWPMHAPEDEIAHQKGRYNQGYDPVRKARYEKMKKLGIIDENVKLTETVGDWEKMEDKEWEARTMEVYAAMVHRMDKGVGRIVEKLRAEGKLDNTLIMFMQDNGGCAETIGRDENKETIADMKPLGPNDLQKQIWPPMQTRDGKLVRTGPGVMAGGPDTYLSYGEGWANVSNTPFTLYKHWSHEGGISTPLILNWKNGVATQKVNQLVREPGHLIDVMATVIDAAGTSYPASYKGNKIAPLAGKSLLPLVQDKAFDRGEPIFFEHESNRAVRDGKWKLVTKGTGPWELYDMDADRSETRNLSAEQPERVKEMSAQWDEWAKKNDVLPLGGWQDSREKDQPDQTTEEADKSAIFRLKAGAVLAGAQRPDVAGRELRINAKISEWADNGVIVSQGGTGMGYSLYAKDGKPVFALRLEGKLYSAQLPDTLKGGEAANLNARLMRDGTLVLRANKTKPARASAPGLLPSVPVDELVVGSDTKGLVGEYGADFKFAGKIDEVVIRTVEPGEASQTGKAKAKPKKKAKRK